MKNLIFTLLAVLSLMSSCEVFENRKTLYLKEKSDPTCYRYVYTYDSNNKLIQSRMYFGELLSSTVNFIYNQSNLVRVENTSHQNNTQRIIELEYNISGLRTKQISYAINDIVKDTLITAFHYYPDHYLKSTEYDLKDGNRTYHYIREYEWKNGNLVKETTRTSFEGVVTTPYVIVYTYDNRRNPYNQQIAFNYISGSGDETYFSSNNLIATSWYSGETFIDKAEFSFKYNKDDYPSESTTQSPYYSHAPLYYKY